MDADKSVLHLDGVYKTFFKREFAQISVERYQIKQIIYDPAKEVIVQWIN